MKKSYKLYFTKSPYKVSKQSIDLLYKMDTASQESDSVQDHILRLQKDNLILNENIAKSKGN